MRSLWLALLLIDSSDHPLTCRVNLAIDRSMIWHTGVIRDRVFSPAVVKLSSHFMETSLTRNNVCTLWLTLLLFCHPELPHVPNYPVVPYDQGCIYLGIYIRMHMPGFYQVGVGETSAPKCV